MGLAASPTGWIGCCRLGASLDCPIARKPFGDFVIAQVVEEFEDRPASGLVDQHGTLAALLGGPGFGIELACQPAEIGMGARSDQFELLVTGQSPEVGLLMADDRRTHSIGARRVTKVAIAMEPAVAVIDPDVEEDRADEAGLEFGHGEHPGA